MALTPAEQAAKSAGWTMPEPNNAVGDGDDAIRANAVRARSAIAAAQTETLRDVNRGTVLNPGDNLDEMRELSHIGRRYIWSAETAEPILGDKPFGDHPFSVDIQHINQACWQIAWPGGNGGVATPMARKWSPFPPVQGWGEWKPLFGGMTADQTAQRAMQLQRSRVRHGGTIGTSGKTVVALSIDHGFANFRDKMLPHLIRLGLPATLAVNTDSLGTGESEGVTLATLQDWSVQHGMELANHSRSHSDATTDEGIRDMILGSLELLHQHCSEVTVDAFVMPGVSGTRYNGFGAGEVLSDWWDHVAGQTILQHHAVVTAAMLGQSVPADGEPVQTVDRASLDSNAWVDRAQARIESLHGTGRAFHAFVHPSRLDHPDWVSTQRMVAFLEWLAAEREAGRLEVLTISAAAWADAGSDRVTDLAGHLDWSNGQATLDLAPLHEWARGSQWQLSAQLPAGGILTVTDDTGALNTSVTATTAGHRRLLFTIPATAQTLTMSIGAGTSPALTPPGPVRSDPRPPTAHTHEIADVDGLKTIIDRLTYDTGWRDVSSLLPAGLAKSTSLGRCNIKWAGGRIYIDMNLNVTETGLTGVMTLPGEYRPDVPIIMPFTYRTATTANTGLPTDLANGYMGAGGSEIRVDPLPSPGTVTIYLDLPALRKTPPTALPGAPA